MKMISNPINPTNNNTSSIEMTTPPQPKTQLSPGLKMLQRYPLVKDFAAAYRITEELGAGGFGFVVGAVQVATGQRVAVKFMFKDKIPLHQMVSDPELGAIPREVYVLRQVRHRNIIQFIDLFQDPAFFYLVMELHGDPWAEVPSAQDASTVSIATTPGTSPVKEHIKLPPSATRQSRDLFESIERAGTFNEPQARHIMKQLISTLIYLQSVNVYHRDIKDENIVIDHHLNIKLVDFGCAVIIPSKSACVFKRFHGTVAYAAPEILFGEAYRADLADTWALGILLHTLMFGTSPFTTPQQVVGSVYRPPLSCSPKLAHLLSGMLHPDPLMRFRFKDIALHPFLR